ncbi:MAG: DUF1028 domain-containing protein [Gemmatimonadota bacterium]|nr:DUF1028 domain-containing protein [Gemmatimonadota bacterium]
MNTGGPLLLALALSVSLSNGAAAQTPWEETEGVGDEPVSTFSIVAFDPETGELGVGIQSRAFRAGAIVPFAKAGLGAIATQASANEAYGPEGLRLLSQGASPAEVVRRLTTNDVGGASRQLAVIDARGRVKAYTGSETSDWNGHIEGENYSVQGNILAGEEVVQAMARTFEASDGTLAERMMDALDAGQAAGGDARGKQAGGIFVVKPIGDDPSRDDDLWVDIRVDDHPEPFVEMRRLLGMAVARNHSRRADALATEGRHTEAFRAQRRAIELQPENARYYYGLAELHARAGEGDEAVRALAEAIEREERYRERAAEDSDFDSIRSNSGFAELIDPRRER